jgi:hypothetical protein
VNLHDAVLCLQVLLDLLQFTLLAESRVLNRLLDRLWVIFDGGTVMPVR